MSMLLLDSMAAPDREAWAEALREAMPDETLWLTPPPDAAQVVDVALVANPPAGALVGLKGLRLVQSLWAGVDGLLRDPTVPTSVPLCRMVDPHMNEAMAETALWAVLSLHRDHFTYAAQQRGQVWRQHPQRRACDVHVGVLGLGQMGRCVAQRLVSNGYRVSGWRTRPGALEGLPSHCGEAGLQEVVSTSDIVINLLPSTPATRGLFNARTFARFRRGAAWVNLARGAHVVEADLIDALDSRQISHAVLDVFAHEPLPATHPFWTHPRVSVLPHVAAQTDPRSAAQVVAANVRALRTQRPLAHRVDRARGY